MIVTALTIIGSEVSSGAGVQTDFKTFHTPGVYGCAAPICTVFMGLKDGWNHHFVPVDPGVIASQTRTCAVVHSRIDIVKIDMLGTAPTIDIVEQVSETYDFPTAVLDPVLICKGQEPGDAFEVDNTLRIKTLPRTTTTTPSLFEAATLASTGEITIVGQLKDAARRIHDQGVPSVLARAGPLLGTDTALDVSYGGTTPEVLKVEAVGTKHTHDAGYTLTVAATAELAKGALPLEAAVTAKEVVSSSVRHGLYGNMPSLYVYQSEHRQG